MENFVFTPIVDLPLTLITLVGFLVNYHFWTTRNGLTNVDLKPRLPRAQFRIILFFAGLFVACWIVNLGVWAVFALIVLLSLLVSIFAGQNLPPEVGFLAAAAILREWSFGFPNLILNAPARTPTHADGTTHELVGQLGFTTSPLRPSGDIEIDGQEFSAISDNGKLIDVGSKIVVTAFRNGRASVVCENCA